MELEPPYVASALFCERVLQEQDGVLSAIRIVDRLIVQSSQLRAGKESPTPVHPISMLISLKAGNYVGSGLLSIRGTLPSGKEFQNTTEVIAELRGGDSGFNIIINSLVPVREQGIYWFDVFFDNRLLTRIPLSVAQSEPLSATEAKPAPKKRPRHSARRN